MQNSKQMHFCIWLTKSKFVMLCHKWKNWFSQLCKTEWSMTKISFTIISWMRLSTIWAFIYSNDKSRRIYRSSLSRTMRQLMHTITEFVHSDKKSKSSKKIRLINFLWSCYSDSLACFLSRITSVFETY